MTIYQKLRELTKLYNKSKVAKKAGIHPTSMCAILKERQGLSLDTAKALAGALNVRVGWLVDDTREWPPEPAEIVEKKEAV